MNEFSFSQSGETFASTNLVSYKQFLRDSSDGGDIYLLLVAEQKVDSMISKEAEGILAEFSDVFPIELPSVLPPMRDSKSD